MHSHCLPALITKRAEHAVELLALEAQADQLRANIVHLDAVLEPGLVPKAIPSRPRQPRREWFRDMGRRACDSAP